MPTTWINITKQNPNQIVCVQFYKICKIGTSMKHYKIQEKVILSRQYQNDYIKDDYVMSLQMKNFDFSKLEVALENNWGLKQASKEKETLHKKKGH